MKTQEQIRLENKLKLWETPGFSQFLSDLEDYSSQMVPILTIAETLKRIYIKQLQEFLPKAKFKQTKIPFK